MTNPDTNSVGCETCGGMGEITIALGQTPGDYEERTEPCPNPIHQGEKIPTPDLVNVDEKIDTASDDQRAGSAVQIESDREPAASDPLVQMGANEPTGMAVLEALFREYYYPPMDKDWRFLDTVAKAFEQAYNARFEVAIWQLMTESDRITAHRRWYAQTPPKGGQE